MEDGAVVVVGVAPPLGQVGEEPLEPLPGAQHPDVGEAAAQALVEVVEVPQVVVVMMTTEVAGDRSTARDSSAAAPCTSWAASGNLCSERNGRRSSTTHTS